MTWEKLKAPQEHLLGQILGLLENHSLRGQHQFKDFSGLDFQFDYFIQ